MNINGLNFLELEKEVERLAEDYLSTMTKENVLYFMKGTKMSAEAILEEYFLSIHKCYSEGPLKISNEVDWAAFIDFRTGYLASMKKWVGENEFYIEECHIKVPLSPTKPYCNPAIPKITLGIGTIVSLGILISTAEWNSEGILTFSDEWKSAVVTELLTMGVAYAIKRNHRIKEQDYRTQLKDYESKINQERNQLVKGIISELKEWLNKAEKKSEELLWNFNIQ